MIVAAHQPNFLPWLGYFDRMVKADLFVLVDHVQFERQNYQNRTLIKTGQGTHWITIPVYQRSLQDRILEKIINNQRASRLRWGRKIGLTLEYAYASSPHYREFAPILREVLDGRWERLVDLNIRLLDICREALSIKTPMLRSSQLSIQGARSEMVLQLCKAVKADAYIAGMGGSRAYLDVDAFQRAGIQVIWQEFHHPVYSQHPRTSSFVKGLSVIDFLFNCGAQEGALPQG